MQIKLGCKWNVILMWRLNCKKWYWYALYFNVCNKAKRICFMNYLYVHSLVLSFLSCWSCSYTMIYKYILIYWFDLYFSTITQADSLQFRPWDLWRQTNTRYSPIFTDYNAHVYCSKQNNFFYSSKCPVSWTSDNRGVMNN